MMDISRVVRLFLLAAVVTVAACDGLPSGPEEGEAGADSVRTLDAPPDAGAGVLSDRARIIDPDRSPLVSTAEQLARGEYRFETPGTLAESVRRNDVIVVRVDGEPEPRLVLRAGTENGLLILDTGPALWSDVVNSGRFGVTAPLGPGPASTLSGQLLPAVGLTGSRTVPPLGTRFELDLCAAADSIMADLELCGDEKEISFTYFATISLAGQIDSLAILDGDIQVSGSMAIEMVVDGGGVTGGRAPTFAPCNRGAFPGCLSTPTGAAFIDWLRTWAPSIPEASLRPVRICVPGTAVRVEPGHWDYSGLIPVWVPGRWERCRITDTGELPTVVLPAVRRVDTEIQPRVRGGFTLFAQGDGKLGLRIPIPYIAYAAGYKPADNLEAKASVGVFVDLSLTVKNTAGSIREDFDEEVRVAQSWTPEGGWTVQTESIRSGQDMSFDIENPDSLVAKAALPVGAELTLSVVSDEGDDSDGGLLDWLGLGAHAKLEIGPFAEATFNREQIDPADPAIDNWHLSADLAYELKPGIGVDIPELFNPPDVRTSWDTVIEFGRISHSDYWGRTGLIVETTTEGTEIDPDGYTAVVTRHDTMPRVIDAGAQRANRAWDHGQPLELAIGTGDAVVFAPGPAPCSVVYSDAAANRVAGVTLAAVRAAGVTIPNYAVVTPTCDLMVARHTVELTGVAANCVVEGGPVRDDVWLLQRRFGANARTDTARVAFNVQCGAAVQTGAISVTADVPAVLPGPFEVRVDGALGALIEPGDTEVLDRLAIGVRTVELAGLPGYCSAVPADVEVLEGGTAPVTITPTCDIPVTELDGTVTASVSHTGTDPGEDFALKLDGRSRAGVAPGGDAVIDGVEPSTPAALLLTRVAGRCRVASPNPVLLQPDTVPSALFVDFDTECTTSAIDTLFGEVTTTAFPVASASLQHDGGDAVRLTGPALGELLQLAGTTVQAWGVRAGTSLDVYGYRVRSSLGEPRWVGIVVQRDGALWLFGEAPIELVDAPPELVARTGELVWVGGDEVDVDVVVPRVFGVIRGSGS
ncbi:MAG: hypothetical protein ACN0LA_10390 [Candidatus Longimicrobiales bacterium M2_2A_002]